MKIEEEIVKIKSDMPDDLVQLCETTISAISMSPNINFGPIETHLLWMIIKSSFSAGRFEGGRKIIRRKP